MLQVMKTMTDSQPTQTLAASLVSALVTTTIAYPLDLAHGRMAADMSKKPSLFIEENAFMAAGKD